MTQHSLAAALAAALTALPMAAQTPPDTFRLPQVVVTATKVPAPAAAIPAHVTVITREELQAGGYTRVVDALRDRAGASVVQLGPPGAVASLFLRGGESDYVQVLVDGVQVNDPGGAYDWAHLSTVDVDRIEVVRGPASVLYGSDAVSGVVQIFTRHGEGRTRVEAEASGSVAERVGDGAEGSYGSWAGSAAAAGSGAVARALAGSWSLSAARQESQGAYAFNNSYENATVAAQLGLARPGGMAVTATARYTDQDYHYPTDGAGNVVDRNRFTYGDALAAGLRVQQPLGSRVAAELAVGAYRGNTGANDPPDQVEAGISRSTGRVERDQLELRVDGRPAENLTVSVGGELERQQGRSTFDSDGPFGPYSSRSDDERRNRAAYVQLVRGGSRLSLTAGGRVDRSDQFGSFRTARVGASWRVGHAVRLHGAWGSGFKEPTFVETYAVGFARGNPALEPERSRSGEVGVRADAGRAHVAFTAFRQSFRNLIQYTFTPPAADAPNYFNMGAAWAEGVELELAASLPAGLRASAGYTGLRTRVTDAGFGEDRQFLEGEALLRRPGRRLDAGLDWQAGALAAALRAGYTGARADLDFTDPAEWQGRRVGLDPYVTVDASLAYRVRLPWGELESTVRLRNLFDERYQEVYNFPAPGRMLSVGFRVGH